MVANPGTVLRIPDFRRLVAVTTISQFGDRLTHMLLITLIAAARPGRLLGYAEGALVFALPTLLLTPVAGVLVDRWDKRKTLATTHLIQSAVLFVTPLAAWLARSYWPCWVAMFIFFGLDLFNNTAAPALLPAVVGEHGILAANSASLALARVATILGMVLGGFLVPWLGWSAGLAVNASTHLAAGLVAYSIVTRLRAPADASPLGRSLAAAVGRFGRELAAVGRLVARSRLIAFVLASTVVSVFISAVAYTVLIYLVQQVLGKGTVGVGVFAGIIAVGMVGGAVVMGFLPGRVNRPMVILAAILLYGLLFIAGWFRVSVPFLVFVALLAGVSYSWLGVVQNTILQEEAAPEARARVFATREFIGNATFITSAVAVGLFGDLTSWRHALAGIGGVLVLLAVLGFLFVRGIRRAEPGRG
jgi:MFS family permease